jgi:methionine-gamma-lyase
MEGTQAAYCTASGMSAISSVLMQLCSSGDHIVASNRLYGGTHAFVDIADVRSVREAMRPSTKVLYFESVSNPQLIVANIPVLAGLFLTPNITCP